MSKIFCVGIHCGVIREICTGGDALVLLMEYLGRTSNNHKINKLKNCNNAQ